MLVTVYVCVYTRGRNTCLREYDWVHFLTQLMKRSSMLHVVMQPISI